MSEFGVIQATLESAARRGRCDRALRGLWRGLLVGALIYLLALAAYKLLPIPDWVPAAGLGAGWAASVLGLILGGWRRASLSETARWVDVRQNLKERLSTALEVSGKEASGEWRALIVADAVEHVKQLDPRRLVPFSLTRASKGSLLVLMLAVGLGFVPEYRSKQFLQQQADAKIIREVGKQLTELTKRTLETRKPAVETTEKSIESVGTLGEKLEKANLTRSDALRDLASATDKLKDQVNDLSKDPALRRMEEAARAPGGQNAPTLAGIQKQIDALKRQLGEKAGDPAALEKLQKGLEQLQEAAKGLAGKQGAAADAAREQLSQSLNSLAQQAAALGVKLPDLDQALAALAANQTDLFLKDLQAAGADLAKLSEMAKQLQQLQAQAADKLGKNLAEQLKLAQADAAQATLKKMIAQLKSANLSPEQLQKILGEVATAVGPASPYGKVAGYLKDATNRMQQGDKPAAAQSLADAAKELENLMQQMGDAQSLMAAMDALKQASLCIGTCQGWGQGQRPGYRRGGKPGSGVGTWADESASWDGEQTTRWDNSGINRPDQDARGLTDREPTLSDALKPTQTKGRFSPGAPMPSITLKGVSIKGASKVQFEEALTAAQSDAQGALNQDKVPRAYQNQVKEYFDDLTH